MARGEPDAPEGSRGETAGGVEAHRQEPEPVRAHRPDPDVAHERWTQDGQDISGEAGQIADAAERRTDPVEIIQRCAHRGLTLATAESLTAGSLAARLADVPGASAALRGGVIAYCNAVKQRLLGVDEDLLESRGAVDPAVAASMARGAASATGSVLGVSTTGVAGPEPHEGKEVGTVYVGLACRKSAAQRFGLRLPEACEVDDHESSAEGAPDTEEDWISGAVLLDLDGDRAAIRDASVEAALKLVEELLLTEPPGFNDPR
ncbi:nicotinamide-nucleotide amidohydrolase family protein [Nesterenkonia xinjiangensis]|uniref:Nicotinamide-nucleotide amidase n=1 Tax=Nesterenkonia xinjiangensis TaxID=225327 RepID=A0A7Z0GNG1_9MICC|nr:nicotinamide-nucleotide amidase [Nesterenkonia xinjiangensis]